MKIYKVLPTAEITMVAEADENLTQIEAICISNDKIAKKMENATTQDQFQELKAIVIKNKLFTYFKLGTLESTELCFELYYSPVNKYLYYKPKLEDEMKQIIELDFLTGELTFTSSTLPISVLFHSDYSLILLNTLFQIKEIVDSSFKITDRYVNYS